MHRQTKTQGGILRGELESALRPLVHFTPSRGFMNDPNGLYYRDGLYHMFFQWNPDADHPGNTHWGHAVSEDLFHWQELEAAIAPDEKHGNIFSGSAVVDGRNVSGLGSDACPAVCLFFTATGMLDKDRPQMVENEEGKPQFPPGFVRPKTTQALAVSVDGGEHFVKYGGNPLVEEIAPMNRDPKVVWNEDADCYTMVLYLKDNDFAFLYSDDLLDWQLGQTITLPGSAECPDLFFLYLDGDRSAGKWVLHVSPQNYIVGHFTGRKFVPETELIYGPTQKPGEKIKSFTQSSVYAPQCFSGMPRDRVVQMSWIPTRFPGCSYVSCMSVPWEIELVTTGEGMRLRRFPAREIEALYGKEERYAGDSADILNGQLEKFQAEAMDVTMKLVMERRGKIAFTVRGILMVYEQETHRLYFPTGVYELPVSPEGGCPTERLELRMIVDRGSIEVFACEGLFQCVWNGCPDVGRKQVEILSMENMTGEITCHELIV